MNSGRQITVLGAVRRRWIIVAVTVALLLAAAAALVKVMPRSYSATATIFLDTGRTAKDFDLGLQTGEMVEQNLIVSATSQPVLRQACSDPQVVCTADELAQPSRDLAPKVHASVLKGTSLIGVQATAPSPDQAAALANAVAKAVIDHDRAQVVGLLKSTRDDLEAQLKTVAVAMTKAQQALAQSSGPSAAARQADLTFQQGQYAALSARIQDLNTLQDRLTSIATIAEPATPPAHPSAPDPPRYLAAALIIGLSLGVLLALLRERFDDRIRTAEGLSRAVGTPLVMVSSGSWHPRALSDQRPYAVAFANLLARKPQMRSVLVAAASPQDYGDPVATGLGTVAARAGQRVFLLRGNGHPGDFQWPTNGEASRMTTITIPPDNGVPAAPKMVAEVRNRFEFGADDSLLVVSVPSPEQSPAAVLLAPTVNQVVLVATAGVTRFSDAQHTADLLRHTGAEIAAAILVTAHKRRA